MALSSGALVLIFFSLYVIHLGLDEVSNPRLQRSLTLGPGVVRPHPRANVLRTGQRSLVEGVAGCRCEPLPITPADQSCGNWHDSQITALARSLGGNSCDNLLCWPPSSDNVWSVTCFLGVYSLRVPQRDSDGLKVPIVNPR